MYGSTRKDRLIEVETRLRHDLLVQSKILRDKKAMSERQRINSLCYSSRKNVYRGFRKNGRIDAEKTPPKKDVKIFGKTSGRNKGRLIRKVNGHRKFGKNIARMLQQILEILNMNILLK